jgi:hypothetical protein
MVYDKKNYTNTHVIQIVIKFKTGTATHKSNERAPV